MAPKPPRLQITKFRGTVLDWPKFWAHFKEDIDETELKPVKKFNLLKELVGETDRTVIENLPSDEARYNRAKKLLENKYGDTNEIVAAYTEQIVQLPTMHGVDVNKIHVFYGKLASCVHVLETMKLIGDIKGNLRMTLNKLPGICENLTAKDENWTNWGFPELVKVLESWTRRNPETVDVDLGTRRNEKPVFKSPKKERIYAVKDRQWKQKLCVFFDGSDRKSTGCTKVTDLNERKKIFSSKKLCFNCSGSKHRASECKSKTGCQTCGAKHHSSLCEKADTLLVASSGESVIYCGSGTCQGSPL